MASYVKRRGEVVLTNIEEQDPDMLKTSPFIKREKFRAFIGIALRVADDILGILYVNFRTPHVFTNQERSTIRLFSHQASSALHNARLYQRAGAQISALERLHEVGSTLTSIPKKPESLRSFLTRIAQSAQNVLGADLVDLYQYFQSQDRYDLPPIQIGERYDEFVIKDTIHKDDVIWKIVRGRRPKYTANAQKSKVLTSPFTVKRRDGPDNRFVIREDIKSTAAIPLMAGEEILGVLFVNYRSYQAFQEQQKRLVELFASQAAIAIWNARLYVQMQKRLDERLNDISAFQQIYEKIYSADQEELMSLIAKKAAQLTGAKYGVLWLADKDRTQLTCVGLAGDKRPASVLPKLSLDKKSINGWVMYTGKPYLSNDIKSDSHYRNWYTDARSELAVPLLYNNNVIGTLDVESTSVNNFTDDHVELLKTLANQAAIAIQNSRIIKKLDTLDDVGQALTSTIRLREQEILDLIYTKASGLMDTDNMYIALYDERTDIVRFGLAFVRGERIDIEKNRGWQPRKAGQGRTEEIIRTGNSILTSTKAQAKEWYAQPGRKEYIGNLLPSWIGVPMVVGNKVIGVIATYHPKQEYVYNRDDLDILLSMATQAAIAIDNARMFYDVNQRLSALVNFEQEVTSVIQSGEGRILELIHEQVSYLMNTQNFYIALYDKSADMIRFGLAFKDGERVDLPSRKAGKGKTEVIIATQKPLFHATYAESKAWYDLPEHKEYTKGQISSSWLGVPMIVRGKTIGVIGTYHITKEYLYDGNDLEFLQAMANQAAIALDNARLYQEARSDAIAAKQLATLGTAIAALQHRINNTLNIIIPNIKRLRSRINVNDPTIKEILDIIERNTRYTSDILMRIQTPLQEVESGSVNVNSLLSDIAGTAKKEWGKNSSHPAVKITLDLDDSIPLIQLPIGQVSEIVRNLIDNAYRAMKKGGKLLITSKMQQNTIYIQLKDTAEGGIPPAIQERLFQKPVPSKEPGHGAGLGLWLSKLMLQGVGGDVTIKETGSTGTTMLIQIPVSASGKEAAL
jgi:GAF domain-containing protein